MDATTVPTVDATDVVALYRQLRLPLTRLAYLLLDDLAEAEDVVHDAFLGLHARGARLRVDGAEAAYLRAAVVNGSRSRLRRRRTSRRHVPPAAADSPGADEPLLVAEEHREVLAALGHLPPRQREVLVLRFWQRLSEAEIAAAMAVSPGTVKSTASRALARLADLLEER